MTITHHPPAELLAEFATGTLDQAQHLVVAVHTTQCPACRRFIRAMEQLAGAALEDAASMPLEPGSFEAVMVRARETPQREVAPQAPATTAVDDGLPDILRRLPLGKRRWVAPGVSVQPILLTGSGKSGPGKSGPGKSGPGEPRSFLLRSAPGTQMLEHSHSGNELTCVLKGTFSHAGGTFNPGDFDFGDEAVDHRPTVGGTEPCLCVVAMTGNLQMNGFLGRLISPFIRL